MRTIPRPVNVDWSNARPALAEARSWYEITTAHERNTEFETAAMCHFGIDLTDPRHINECLLRWYVNGPMLAAYATGPVREYLEITQEQARCLQLAVQDAWADLVLRLEPYLPTKACAGHITRQRLWLQPVRSRHLGWSWLGLSPEQSAVVTDFNYWRRVVQSCDYPLLRAADAKHVAFPVDLDWHNPLAAYLSVAAMRAMLETVHAFLSAAPSAVPDTAMEEFKAIVLNAFLTELPSEYRFLIARGNQPTWPLSSGSMAQAAAV